MRCPDSLIPCLKFSFFGQFFEFLNEYRSFGHPQGKPRTHIIIEGEKLHGLADPAMITLASFFLSFQPLIELCLVGKGCSVDTLKLGVFFIPPVVGRSHSKQFERLDIACSHHVRSRTEVHEGAILIEGDFFTLGNILQAFHLEGLSPLLKISRGLLSGFGLSFKDLVLLDHFLHLSLDSLEIFRAETMVLEIKVVVVTFIGRRTNVQFGLRPETCDGSGHDVGTGVA